MRGLTTASDELCPLVEQSRSCAFALPKPADLQAASHKDHYRARIMETPTTSRLRLPGQQAINHGVGRPSPGRIETRQGTVTLDFAWMMARPDADAAACDAGGSANAHAPPPQPGRAAGAPSLPRAYATSRRSGGCRGATSGTAPIGSAVRVQQAVRRRWRAPTQPRASRPVAPRASGLAR
jgi:hypothetical protein